MTLRDLAMLARATLAAQKKFFRLRKSEFDDRRLALEAAKALEAKLTAACDEVLAPPGLFAEGIDP